MDTDFSINVMSSSTAKGMRSKRPRPNWFEQQGPWNNSSEDEHESEDEEMAARSLMLLSHGSSSSSSSAANHVPSLTKRVMKKAKESIHSADSPYQKSSYKCKTCSKSFLSFQALGGHRASCSHTSITGLAHHSTAESNEKSSSSSTSNKMKLHECTICHRAFSSGQALGGHKRTHSSPSLPTHEERAELDLNMPAPLDDCYTLTKDSSAAHCKDYKMSPPFWWMTSSGKRVPSVYNGNIADEAENQLVLGRDLGLKPDLFTVAIVN